MTIADANRGPRIRVGPATDLGRRGLEALVRLLGLPFSYLGDRAALFLRATGALLRRPFRGALILEQMQFVGVGSLPIIVLVGMFSGGVAADSALEALKLFQQQAQVGGLVGVSLARELAPVFAALMLSARTGAGMASELGSMRLTEQVDALQSFGVDPAQYLVVPRLVASMIMAPAMTLVFNALGLFGAYVVAIHLKNVDPGAALQSFFYYTDPLDYLMGVLKAIAFGLAYSLVACYRGLTVRGGARELGRATTSAVVEGAVLILVLDYFLTDLFIVIWPARV